MSYQVLLLPRSRMDLDSFDGRVFAKICIAINNLAKNPRPVGGIKLTNDNGHRIRVGDYRVLYRIDDKGKKVFIYRVRHRREVYR
ncbi:MAG: type II toxin-antitoxin system RelE/ParE family toxin [Pseudomonadota bacterium]